MSRRRPEFSPALRSSSSVWRPSLRRARRDVKGRRAGTPAHPTGAAGPLVGETRLRHKCGVAVTAAVRDRSCVPPSAPRALVAAYAHSVVHCASPVGALCFRSFSDRRGQERRRENPPLSLLCLQPCATEGASRPRSRAGSALGRGGDERKGTPREGRRRGERRGALTARGPPPRVRAGRRGRAAQRSQTASPPGRQMRRLSSASRRPETAQAGRNRSRASSAHPPRPALPFLPSGSSAAAGNSRPVPRAGGGARPRALSLRGRATPEPLRSILRPPAPTRPRPYRVPTPHPQRVRPKLLPRAALRSQAPACARYRHWRLPLLVRRMSRRRGPPLSAPGFGVLAAVHLPSSL